MKTRNIDRADLEANVVEALLDGARIVVVAATVDAGAGIFRTIAEAFVDDAGDMIAGAEVRKTKGRERLDLRNGGRLYTANARTADLSVRGIAVDRVYTPAGTGDKLLRVYEAATIQSPAATVLTYQERVEA